MLTLPASTKIYLARDAVDLRKSIDGLSIMVTTTMRLDVKQPALFVFFNRYRDKVKVLGTVARNTIILNLLIPFPAKQVQDVYKATHRCPAAI